MPVGPFVYLLWKNVYSVSMSILKSRLIVVFLNELYEFLVHFRYQSLIGPTICKYFIPSIG